MDRPCALVLAIAIMIFSSAVNAQRVLSKKELYATNKDAVVEIGINGGQFSGNGFIVSADGVIVTANHVVTTRDSKFKEYAKDIVVRVFENGKERIYPATPINATISEDQTNFDTAKLKITATGLPHVTLGKWTEAEIGDQVFIIPSWPGYETMMLEGFVSGKGPSTVLGPKAVNTIFFQSPVRNGFSGSPIFSDKGRVIGIVDTKVYGINPALDDLRTKWGQTKSNGSVRMFGIDIAGSFLELINNLDQNLISGLGSGISIEYAEQQ